MIHNDIQNQLQLLIKASAPPLVEVAQHPTETPQWTLGQRLPAYVLASLPSGRFEVRVGDQILDLNLPRNTQAGDTLELMYVASSPRLTFALTRDLAGTLPANSPVSLSETAKFIGGLLQKGATDISQAGQAARAAPVLTAPPAAVADFAQALRQAVSTSGLFYESHQAQWLNGERSLSALLQEPQGKLSAHAANPEQAALPGTPAKTETPARNAEAALPASASSSGQEASVAKAVHPQAMPLVQQQLETLDTRQMVWQGQVWPGQDMYWEIEEDSSRGAAEEDDAPTWHTRLNLQLPTMGGVTARLAFVQGMVRLDISADSAASADLMRGQQADLATSFENSGLKLSGVVVRHE